MKAYPKYLDWLRYLCAWFLFFYGISKLTGHQLTVPGWVAKQPIGSLDGQTLTWYYYSYSHAYRMILGFLQVFAALLLLFRRTALLAAVLMTPVMANIVLINLFYVISPGAETVALFLFAALLLILWHQREAFRDLLWTGQPSESPSSKRLHWTVRSIVLLYALGVLAVGTVAFDTLHSFADAYQRRHVVAK